MTLVISSDIISVGDALTTSTSPSILNNDLLFLTAGTNLISSQGDAIETDASITNYEFILAGSVYGDQRGINISANSAYHDFSFSVLAGGSITAQYGAIAVVNADGSGTTGFRLSNAGEMTSIADASLSILDTEGVWISNTGSIVSLSPSIVTSNAIFMRDAREVSVRNDGLLENASYSPSDAPFYANDVATVSANLPSVYAGSTFTLINSGILRGISHSVYSQLETVRISNTSEIHGTLLFDNSATATIANTGLITGARMLFGTGTGASSDDRVFNSGVIENDMLLYAGNDTVINRGDLMGNVDLGSGDDIFLGAGGLILGEIQGGAGNDTLIVDALADYQDTSGIDDIWARIGWELSDDFENLRLLGSDDISGTGNTADNVMTGNVGDNQLDGAGGDDDLSGASGNDTVDGANGNDTLRGGVGDDLVRGGSGLDVVTGGTGNDTLEGGVGDDILNGQGDDDVLVGGGGRDVMVGGAGNDVFVFSSVGDTNNSAASADRINDFEQGADRIDLSGAGIFTFLGTGAFTGSGVQEIRATVNGAGHTQIFLDADGDGNSDGLIFLLGFTGLVEADLIL